MHARSSSHAVFRVRAHRHLNPLVTFCFQIRRAERVSPASSTNHVRREEPVITASLWSHTVAQNVFVHLKAVTRTQSDRMKRKRLVSYRFSLFLTRYLSCTTHSGARLDFRLARCRFLCSVLSTAWVNYLPRTNRTVRWISDMLEILLGRLRLPHSWSRAMSRFPKCQVSVPVCSHCVCAR